MKHVREHGATEHYFSFELFIFWLLVTSLSTSLQLFIYWSGQRLKRPVLNTVTVSVSKMKKCIIIKLLRLGYCIERKSAGLKNQEL